MLLRPLLLLLLVGLVYSAAVIIVLRRVTAFIKKRREEIRDRSRPALLVWAERAILGLAVIGVFCFAWALWVEPYWPQVTTTRVEVEGLAADAPPLRIVALSDLHADEEPRLEGRLAEVVAGLEPDLIVFTGDALNTGAGVGHFRALMTQLAAIAPTFAVRGNWDVWFWRDQDLYGSTGVRLLDGDAARVELDGRGIWIAGSAVEDELGLERALDGLPDEAALTLFLHHYPERVAEASEHGVDLVISGDTHGGQIRLPLIGPLIEMSRFGRYFDMGLHRVGETRLYVNRGIGMEGGDAPRMRFLCRPEVALIEVRGLDVPRPSGS